VAEEEQRYSSILEYPIEQAPAGEEMEPEAKQED
jgi:hypothetical protein